jgi:threonyl-tRNA synthetase
VQCDFNLPERFNLEYVDTDGSKKRPVMLHRAIFGSIERFFGVLLESTAGELPFWLAPVQVRLLPVTDAAREAAMLARDQLLRAGVRAEVDRGSDRLGKQIRNAEQARIPVMCVVGEAEAASGSLAVRSRKGGEAGSIKVADFVAALADANEKACEPVLVGSANEHAAAPAS